MINRADEFILLDDVQFTRRDWRNRNLIKTADGLKWLTIPVNQDGSRELSINEITVAGEEWRKKHWDSLRIHYGKTPFFHHYADALKDLYFSHKASLLSEINYTFIATINSWLGINTPISWSTDYNPTGDKNQKLINLCKACGADTYLSGPAAQSYLDKDRFEKENIHVEWMEYNGYPEYNQLYPPFQHGVTILDLLFNEGPRSTLYMKSFT